MQEKAYRPDVVVYDTQQMLLLDVVVTHPCAHHLKDGARRAAQHAASVAAAAAAELYSAKAAEAAKCNERRTGHAEHLGAKFVPFAVEAYGALGAKAQEVVKRIGDTVAEHTHASSLDCRRQLRLAVGVALQRGNARVYQEGIRRAREYGWRLRGGDARR